MSRFAHAHPSFEIPEAFPELANARVLVLDALSEAGALVTHAFAAQDARLVLQGAASEPGAMGSLVDECGLAPGRARVFESGLPTLDAGHRLSEAALRAFGGLDVLVCHYDLRAQSVTQALQASDEVAGLFETQVTLAELVAAHMSQRTGGAIVHVAHTDDPLTAGGPASLARAALAAVVSGQARHWAELDVIIGGVCAHDFDDDRVATELSGASLMMASRRADWLGGHLVEVN